MSKISDSLGVSLIPRGFSAPVLGHNNGLTHLLQGLLAAGTARRGRDGTGQLRYPAPTARGVTGRASAQFRDTVSPARLRQCRDLACTMRTWTRKRPDAEWWQRALAVWRP